MNTAQTNRVNMFKTVAGVLDSEMAVWNTMAPFVTAVADYKSSIGEIDATVQSQETPTGATQAKADARDALEDALFLLCRALGFLAHKGGDNDLRAMTDLTRSDIDKFDAEALSNRAAAVLAQANARKTELLTVQVTQENIDEVTHALSDYNATKATPRQAAAERGAATEALIELINKTHNILRNEIDQLVPLYSRTNPDFVAAYNRARAIVDRPATHTAKATGGSTPGDAK